MRRAERYIESVPGRRLTEHRPANVSGYLAELANQDRGKVSRLGRAAASTLQVYQALLAHPLATSGSLVGKLGLSPATVNKALGHLEQLGIVKELTARNRNRVFSYASYIDIMNRGTELPDS